MDPRVSSPSLVRLSWTLRDKPSGLSRLADLASTFGALAFTRDRSGLLHSADKLESKRKCLDVVFRTHVFEVVA